MPPNVSGPVPEVFARSLRELSIMPWRPHFVVDEIGSPQRIAPYAVAVSGELEGDEDPRALGRLILLHDPAGNSAWGGTFRLVTYAKAEVEIEMVTDPLLPDVTWSWFTESLESTGAIATAIAGTVTSSYNRGFGEMSDADRAEVELRCSWTPTLDATRTLTPHLKAWQNLMFHIAGEPILPTGIATLPTAR
ncbi:DUF3000 domain-containing protein [Tessaracoccus defluvii]|uniref:DUF3000 domain-containing protein n=1 Tax=Tessaracoccus defluvii TaxID=1285901 RepID=A0A7H0H8I8_9ACTN|nr:DUF3000 domain-containing protein [Tessaracoccus defluvii]QNP56854.1 DUF3000 domain-containing protein [Tessaracoccus defluvii]